MMDQNQESFKPCIYNKNYKIGDKGTIIGARGKVLKWLDTCTKYASVEIRTNGIRKIYKVHRLVAIHFVPNNNNKPQVNHIDEDTLNNNAGNLEWVTAEENSNHGTRNIRKALACQKKVYSKDIIFGLLIVYDSIKQAAKCNNVSPSSIQKACKNNTLCNSLEWRYYNA